MEFLNATLFDGAKLHPNARLSVDADGRFADSPSSASRRPSPDAIDLGGRLITPALIDCHTHLIWAGSRENEFEERLTGATYQQIMARGGGIRSTMAKVRAASEDELFAGAWERLERLKRQGVLTVEIKSGYGLSAEAELKMLRAARALGERSDVEVSTTLLAAHALPPEYANDREGYLRLMIEEIIPAAAREKLADAVDVFCEKEAFTLDETRRVFEAAQKHGLAIKVHSDQFANLGATKLAAEMGALSADHLEKLGDADIEALRQSRTVAVLLPGASLFLNAGSPPVAKLRAAGVPMAVATDCNPGSSHTTNLHLMMSLACIQMRAAPMEALAGVTWNAARALGIENRVGSIAPGRRADFVVWRCSTPAAIPYSLGENLVEKVYKGGRLVHDAAVSEPVAGGVRS